MERPGGAKGGAVRRRRQLYLGSAVSIAACIWLFRSVEAEEIFNRVRSVNLTFLAGALLLTVASYLLRAWRWPFFFDAAQLPFWTSFRCVIVGFFMNNLLPARMGELVRAHLGGKALGMSRALVLATIAGERLIDGLVISLLFGVIFSLGATARDQAEGQVLFLVAYGFVAVGVGTAIVLCQRQRVFALLDRFAVRAGERSRYALTRARHFIEGLLPMFRPHKVSLLTLSSLIIWGVELSVYALVGEAFHADLSIAHVSLFFAATNFSSLIPAAPAGIGVIEAFATAALVHVGVDPETALAMVATQHLIQISVVGIPGSFLFFHRFHGHLPVDEEESSDG